MRKMFYMKLAAANIKKNSAAYIPYLLTCIGTIAMYNIMYALGKNEGLQEVYGGGQLAIVLMTGTYVIAFFSAIFLFYTHSFLIKKRKKEFGLYNILGMEKKHIAKILFYETLYTSVGSLIVGLLAGTLLSKLFYLILLKIANLGVPFNFRFSWKATIASLILFGVVFLLTFLETVWQIRLSKPIELLSGGKTGEKEPKTKWIMAIFGLLSLGIGYYIAVTTTSPLSAIPLFLVAVIAVMIGTYCLFTSGSIAVLKVLRKNKNYYYQTKHFTAVSGMIYRMKQNAVGLANICILSTGFLLMISASISLYGGLEDLLKQRYPDEIAVYVSKIEREDVQQIKLNIQDEIKKMNIQEQDSREQLSWSCATIQDGNDFQFTDPIASYSLPDAASIQCITAIQYERQTGEKVALGQGEVFIHAIHGAITGDTINFNGEKIKIAGQITGDNSRLSKMYMLQKMYFFIFPDEETIEAFFANAPEEFGDNNLRYSYAFDTGADEAVQKTLAATIEDRMRKGEGANIYQADEWYIECREKSRADFNSLYGGMFFVGTFMGILFLMGTVLIIYYKQISEGYDDRDRFEIMQKVGMSQREVRGSIRSQVLTVFFIPLITACIHMVFAFPIMRRLMALLNLTNVTLFIAASIATVVLFAIIYVILYLVTAKAYYKIVRRA